MKLLIKVLIKNFFSIRVRNLFINNQIKGERGRDSFILAFGDFKFGANKGAKINISNGQLVFNKIFSKPDYEKGVLKMMENFTINVKNNFDLFSGHYIILMENAILNLGSGYINYNLKIRCHSEITIGENVAFSENLIIWDSDAHEILGNENGKTQPVKIGDHVWIGTNVTILKGVTSGDGAIISADAVVSRSISARCLAGGVPAKVIKEHVEWK